MKKEHRKGPKRKSDFDNDSSFYEEIAILKAQEVIAELMTSSQVSKTELASRLGQTKAHVTELLSEDRNLTLRSFGRVCFHLGAEIVFQTRAIGELPIISATYDTNIEPTLNVRADGLLQDAYNTMIYSSGSPIWEPQNMGVNEGPLLKTNDNELAA